MPPIQWTIFGDIFELFRSQGQFVEYLVGGRTNNDNTSFQCWCGKNFLLINKTTSRSSLQFERTH